MCMRGDNLSDETLVSEPRIGYKVFLELGGALHGQFRGWNGANSPQNETYQPGIEYTATRKEIPAWSTKKGDSGKSYPGGFHIFPSLADANRYCYPRAIKMFQTEQVYKVSYRGRCTHGWQIAGGSISDCVAAEYSVRSREYGQTEYK